MKYMTIAPSEDIVVTRAYLQARSTEAYNLKEINCAECDIYMRGQVWAVEYENKILYYETHVENYPFFENAFHYLNCEKYAKWKTVDTLITFRNAIREATVQGTDYCERFLEDEEKPLTKEMYREFMSYARAHDFIHHGSHTF